MADRVVLHIGMPKCATTFVQTVLWSNQRRLADLGVLVPGSVKFDHNRAAQAVYQARPDARAQEVWGRFARESNAWDGTVVISNEWFSRASKQQARRAVQALAPAEVHIVVTARDLVRSVPSAWQETLKLGLADSLEHFISSLDRTSGRWRWSTLDPSTALQRWQAWVPPERIHVVPLSPRPGEREVVWHRFAHVLGVDAAQLELSGGTTNESLGAEAARLLQLVGPALREAIDADRGPWQQPYRWIRDLVSHELLVPQGGHPIALRPENENALRTRARQSLETLARAGYDICGALDELVDSPRLSGAVHPDEVSDAALLDLAEHVMAGLLGHARRESHRADAATSRARDLDVRSTNATARKTRTRARVVRLLRTFRPARRRGTRTPR